MWRNRVYLQNKNYITFSRLKTSFGSSFSSATEDYSYDTEKQTIQDDSNKKLYNTHIPTTPLQKILLSVGSTLVSLYRPQRDDMIAVSGETAGQFVLPKMYRVMVQDPEGQEILRDRPRINSSTVDFSLLQNLPADSLGAHYLKFLDDNMVTPDSRLPVQFIDDPDLAYVMQRYREVHDLIHTVLGMPTNMLGEVAVKWVEALQTGLPMCYLASFFGPLRFAPKQRQHYATHLLPWAIRCGFQSKCLLNIYYEKRWSQSIESLREEFNIETPPEVPQKKKKH